MFRKKKPHRGLSQIGLPTLRLTFPGHLNAYNLKTDATEAYDTRMTSKATVRAARHGMMIEQRY